MASDLIPAEPLPADVLFGENKKSAPPAQAAKTSAMTLKDPTPAAKSGEYGGTLLAALIAGYFLPWLLAKLRGHHNSLAIFWLNALAGWTGLGWLFSLIWSLTATTKPSPK